MTEAERRALKLALSIAEGVVSRTPPVELLDLGVLLRNALHAMDAEAWHTRDK